MAGARPALLGVFTLLAMIPSASHIDLEAQEGTPPLSPEDWGSYLGGICPDQCTSLAMDEKGNLLVAGWTAGGFPATAGGQQGPGGQQEGFVAKFSAGGELVWSMVLGGSSPDRVDSIAVDESGDVYAVGGTSSYNFPVAEAFQVMKGYSSDAFVVKIPASGEGLLWSTFLGGNGNDLARAVTVAADGDILVTGYTSSPNFPVTSGAFQSSRAGGYDAFVV